MTDTTTSSLPLLNTHGPFTFVTETPPDARTSVLLARRLTNPVDGLIYLTACMTPKPVWTAADLAEWFPSVGINRRRQSLNRLAQQGLVVKREVDRKVAYTFLTRGL